MTLLPCLPLPYKLKVAISSNYDTIGTIKDSKPRVGRRRPWSFYYRASTDYLFPRWGSPLFLVYISVPTFIIYL